MAVLLSPGVNVTEFDLTTIVPAVSTSTGAIAGIFNWGPVGERVLIGSETELVQKFGQPTSRNAETWFTAANFLGYGNSLWVVRAANTTTNTVNSAYNAIANTASANVEAQVVRNELDFYNRQTAFDTNVEYVAKFPGSLGNSLKISVCDSVNAYSSNVTSTANVAFQTGSNSSSVIFTGAANTSANTMQLALNTGDYILVGNSVIGTQYMQLTNSAITTNSTTTTLTLNFADSYRLHTPYTTTNVQRFWEFFNVVGHAPSQTAYVAAFNSNTAVVDGLHVVVVDENGAFTGVPGTVLEVHQDVSRATDAVTPGNSTNYYKTVINQDSGYVWAVNDRSNAVSDVAANVVSSTDYLPITLSFGYGQDGFSESTADLAVIASAYDQFASKEDVIIDLLMQGKPIAGSTTSGGFTIQNTLLAQYLIQNVVEKRNDCVVFITPDDQVVLNNLGNEAAAIVAWRNAIDSTSYAVMDSGYKYQYDRYNDVYRWIPMNGDIAGLCARTDKTNDAWWSPGGYNRGQIKNVVKLRFNPDQTERDYLYPHGVNPIVTFPGEGTILFGDKTLLSKPSAFDRINVRRLFLVLERAISTASKYTLFEFNDAFTQTQFKNLIIPYLRDVQGRRGITDFLVVCDGTNNTPQVVDSNKFVGDIYIKPARAINFIQLNFIAVATGVQFSTVVGTY